MGGTALKIHPEIFRQRLALVETPWAHCCACSRKFRSQVCSTPFPRKHCGSSHSCRLISELFHRPGAQEGCWPQIWLHLTTSTGFYREAGEALAAQG